VNVLSLFDGISIARLALKNLNIDCTYYASEVDKYCIQISEKHFPDIIRLGDVKNVSAKDLPKIDLLIGGSPCQDLSRLKRNRKGLAGKKSRLFYEYFRLLKECDPKYFLFENVASMDVIERQKISDALKINPTLINSSLLTAQFRSRYYWTNIKFPSPKDKKILLSGVIRGGGIQIERSHIVLQLHILLQMKQTIEEGNVK
jgi:DNA-cytosine methyltransferase